MRPWLKIAALAVVAFLFGAVAVHPQEVSDLGALAHDLRQSLKDLDGRLRQLERVVKQFSDAADKSRGRSRPDVASTAAPVTPNTTLSKFVAAQQAYQQGKAEEGRQEYSKAIESYSKAADLDPRNDSAFLHRGLSNFQMGRLDQALSDLNRALSIQPNNSHALELRSRVYRTMKDYDHSMADLEEALLRDGNNPEYLLSQASLEEERGDFKKAAEIYGKALKIDPSSETLYLKRASALKEINEVDQAFEACGEAIGVHPNAAEGYACRADAYVRMGQLPNAIVDLNHALRLKPTLPDAAQLLPVVKQLLEVNQVAKQIAPAPAAAAPVQATPVQAAPAPPESAPPAAASVESNAPGSSAPVPAAPALQPSAPVAAPMPITRNPEEKARRLVAMGRTYLDRGMFSVAIQALGEALSLDPSSAVAYNSRGYAFLRTREYKAAIHDFSAAIRLNPAYANAYWNRGIVRRITGDTQGGKEDMEKAGHLGWPTDTLAYSPARTH